MVWTKCSSHRILLKQTELWLGQRFFSHRILLEHERNYGWGMDALVIVTVFSLGMHALITVFSWNTNDNYGLDWML